MFKKVESEHLEIFRLMLGGENVSRDTLDYFDKNILKIHSLNDLKRRIYLSMKDLQPIKNDSIKNNVKYKLLYGLYQDLKKKNISQESAWNKYIDII